MLTSSSLLVYTWLRFPVWHNIFIALPAQPPYKMARNSDSPNAGDSSEMQKKNATGADNNEQGHASFTTPSATGGGSNYGQGSSNLGGESYHQGETTNSGSNYQDEAGRLSSSSTGTSD